MKDAAVLTLAGLCIGVALSGLLATVRWQGRPFERLSLGSIYALFIAMVALPIVGTFAQDALVAYMPILPAVLLALPPALHRYVVARTSMKPPSRIPWRDLALPAAGCIVALGFWALPASDRETMFILGELPPGVLPAALALATFALIMVWPVVSFAYLLAVVRQLTAYRAHIRELYSDAETRDLRWVDVVMVLLVLIWAAGALSLADKNLAGGNLVLDELFLALIATGLLVLTIFAPVISPASRSIADVDEPEIKYARSALTMDHMSKLASRLETAMRDDSLYLDPNLSLQKLAQHVGALPNQVSQTLNQKIGLSFFDYVAHWRIEASKPMIAAGEASVLTVAMDVGFNSRSAFYKAFKRATGMTPKGFRNAATAVS